MAARRKKIIPAKEPQNKNLLPAAARFFGKTLILLGKPLWWVILLLGYGMLLLIAIAVKLRFIVGFFVYLLNCLVNRFLEQTGKLLLKGKRLIMLLSLPAFHRPNIMLPKISILLPIPKFRFSLFKKVCFIFLLFVLVFGLSGYFFYQEILKDLPSPNKLVERDQAVTTKINDRNGKLLYKVYLDQNRTPVGIKDIPQNLINATLAIEDSEFYQHNGLSIKGILRAIKVGLQGEKIEGGSTITQQLVKNALLSPERTIRRKIKEVLLAIAVERRFTKDQILQMYFNEVGYGGSSYGIEEASQLYFGKSVKNLNLAEGALLAGLPASPTTYSPFGANPNLAKKRQEIVLQRMFEEGFITRQEKDQAVQEKIIFKKPEQNIKAPHFVMYVRELLVQEYGEKVVEEGGLEVTTSLDIDIQNYAQTVVEEEVEKLKNMHVGNGAALITKPQTGEILAMVGSKNYFDLDNDGNFNVTTSLRQPGSSIKPINYSVALDMGFTAATLIPDTPISYNLPGQPLYSPRNYDGKFHGNVPLRVALGSSYNIPAVKILSSLGVSRMIEQGQKMGITTWNDPSQYGLSLTLGGGEVKMTDMSTVYGTLANMGTRVDLQPILRVKNYQGKVLKTLDCSGGPSPKCSRQVVVNPKIAFILTDILSDNSARTPAFGSRSLLNIPNHPHVAVKTGTTQNLRDNWAIGYTPDYLVTTWVGNNDNTPMSRVASGVTGASPIWNRIMTKLLADTPDKGFLPPEGILRLEICPGTFALACNGCGGKWEFFINGTQPKNHCDPEKIKEGQNKQTN